MEMTREPSAPADVVRDMQTVLNWFGVTREQWEQMSIEEQRPHHEKWARGFEKYVATGEAPTSALAKVFESFKNWIVDVYKSLTKLNVEVPKEIQDVMARMLGKDELSVTKNLPDVYKPAALLERAKELGLSDRGKAEWLSAIPFTDELKSGPGTAGDRHPNVGKINSLEDVKLYILKASEVDQNKIAQSRGGDSKSLEQTRSEAIKEMTEVAGGSNDDIRMLTDERMKGPSADATLGAWRILLVDTAKYSVWLRDQILDAGRNASDELQLQYLASIERTNLVNR
jgi:hypothetical protein